MNLAAKVARRRDTTIENFGTHLPPRTFNSGIAVTPFLTFKCIPAIGLPPPPFRLQRKVVRAALNPPRLVQNQRNGLNHVSSRMGIPRFSTI
jgi:hypothetical protein